MWAVSSAGTGRHGPVISKSCQDGQAFNCRPNIQEAEDSLEFKKISCLPKSSNKRDNAAKERSCH